MSACTSWSGNPSSPTTEPPKRSARLRARSAWRLATKIVPAPCSASARAVSSLVSPAPRITTWRSFERPEHARRQIDRDRGHAHAARADLRLCAHALAGCSAAANRRLVSGARAPGPHRRLVRAADLALDLGLADDHRLEAGGDAEELARGVAVARRVDRPARAPSAGSPRGARAGRARRPRRDGPRRRRPGRPRCGCRSRSRPPRAPRACRRRRRTRPASLRGEREALAQRHRAPL